MKDAPLLFSAPMIRALLDGRKSQTRRLAWMPSHLAGLDFTPEQFSEFEERGWRVRKHGELHYVYKPTVWQRRYDRWMAGDRELWIWVRETWAHYQTVNGRRLHNGGYIDEISDGFAGYRADGFDTINDFRDHVRLMSDASLQAIEINGNKWRPSIHMPKWASRLTLRVTDMRLERLQDISEEDAKAEGALWHDGGGIGHSGWRHDQYDGIVFPDARSAFARLWQNIHGPDSWARNDEIVRLEFEVFKANIDAIERAAA